MPTTKWKIWTNSWMKLGRFLGIFLNLKVSDPTRIPCVHLMFRKGAVWISFGVSPLVLLIYCRYFQTDGAGLTCCITTEKGMPNVDGLFEGSWINTLSKFDMILLIEQLSINLGASFLKPEQEHRFFTNPGPRGAANPSQFLTPPKHFRMSIFYKIVF